MQKPQLPMRSWQKWSIFTSSDLTYESKQGALLCNTTLQQQTACLAPTPWDTARSPSFTELKTYLELEGGTNRKLAHEREHYSGWFAVLRSSYCMLHNLTLAGDFPGLPVERTPVIQPQGYQWHHLLSLVNLYTNPAEAAKLMQVSRTISGHVHAYLCIYKEIRRITAAQNGQRCWKRNFCLPHLSYSFL